MLMDALEKDMTFLNELAPLLVLEIGSGSGLVINFIAKHLANSKQALFFSTDINANVRTNMFVMTFLIKKMDFSTIFFTRQKACLATKKTSEANSNAVNIITADLMMPMLDRLKGKLDILIFNPPYVCTEVDELGSTNLQAAWAGGPDGRKVMNRLFPYVNELLAPQGVFYLVCIKQNKIEQIEEILRPFGFQMTIVLNRKAGIENLFILRFNRTRD